MFLFFLHFITDYALHFPNSGVNDFVNIWGMPSLAEYTVCLWMQSKDAVIAPFSYAVSGSDNELLIDHVNNFQFHVNGKRMEVNIFVDNFSSTNSLGRYFTTFSIWTLFALSLSDMGDPSIRTWQNFQNYEWIIIQTVKTATRHSSWSKEDLLFCVTAGKSPH